MKIKMILNKKISLKFDSRIKELMIDNENQVKRNNFLESEPHNVLIKESLFWE